MTWKQGYSIGLMFGGKNDGEGGCFVKETMSVPILQPPQYDAMTSEHPCEQKTPLWIRPSSYTRVNFSLPSS